MVSVSDLSTSAEKFERRAGQAGQDYEDGVSAVSDSEQQEATLDAVDNYIEGVQQSISNGDYEDGVANPSQSWQERSLDVGRQRFQQSASDAGPAWETGFQPIANALESLSLPERGAKGGQENRDRMNQVYDELSQL